MGTRAIARRAAAGLVGVALLAATFAGCDWPDGTRYVDKVFDCVDATTDVVYRTTTNSAGQTVDPDGAAAPCRHRSCRRYR